MNIADNEIHIWYACDEEIDAEFALLHYKQFLTLDELEQYKKFYFEKNKHQYLVTRTLVRHVLCKYLQDVLPMELKFVTNTNKKPYVSPSQMRFPLQFNISHTDKMIVIAVTKSNEVGIDVEYLDRDNCTFDIAERFFAESEYQQLKALSPEQQKRRFFSLWTLKEAYVKACGKGLYIPLDEFWFSFPCVDAIDITFSASRYDDPNNWQFWQIEPDKHHLVSLAIQQNPSLLYNLVMRKITPLLGNEIVNYLVTASKT
ncbi:4'-phosphopantetheinyl transferase family protein [Photorhabdus sp. RM71S]|uniref:4'-phosphopantetheinyl transferase family protein n=1 Tax=Photorhabdus sp. RM71S TaxID=3342824 RepID=UPI0036DB6366